MTTQNPFEDTDRVLDRITDKFDERYDGEVPRETIEEKVHEAYSELAEGAVTDSMLPALTEHEVGDRLAEEVGRPAPLAESADGTPSGGQLRAGAADPEGDQGGLGRPVGPQY
ncbi:three-helix bundle dimerization domain-containing protein [Cryptosporangium sp. NPDC048952]|uniref:three-helix bundle dimerization domain-containing protein n=1 Tax=Cryptosporangium sp. NPDC048952 TaxID=3363961 RepID=UPI003720EA9F